MPISPGPKLLETHVLWLGLAHSAPFLGGRRTFVPSFPTFFFPQSPPGPRTYVVILLFIPKAVAKFSHTIKIVNVLRVSWRWAGEEVVPFTFQTPGLGEEGPCSILCWLWVHVNSTFTCPDVAARA